MRTSEQIDQIAAALIAAHRAMSGKAPAKATNPHFKNRYATLEDVTASVRAPLLAHGIVVIQGVGDADEAGLTLLTRLLHTSGQWIETGVRLPVEKPNAQGAGSAISYGRRYGLAAALGIVEGEDDDGNAAAEHPASAQARAGATAGRIAARAPANGTAPTEKQVAFFTRLLGSGAFSDEERTQAEEWLAMKATRETIKGQLDTMKQRVDEYNEARRDAAEFRAEQERDELYLAGRR